MTKIVNMYAGPSAGKSTLAAGLFYRMKHARLNVELASEFAKDVVWSKDFFTMEDQYYLFGCQHQRIYKLLGQVDWIITDCPLMLMTVYSDDNKSLAKYDRSPEQKKAFKELVLRTYLNYQNYDFFVERGNRKFIQQGRMQNLDQSIEKDQQIKAMLDSNGILYSEVSTVEQILDDLGLEI